MTRIIGRTASIGIATEATRGTALAADFWVPVQTYDFDDKDEKVKNDSGFGHIAENNEADIIKLWAEGEYDGKIFDQSVGTELVAVFGQVPTSVQRTTTGVYDHTYALLNNNAHKSLSLSYKDANEDLRYSLAMVNVWSIEAAVDQYLKRKVSYISKKSTSSAGNTVAYTNENEFIPDDLNMYLADAVAGLDAASASKITAFNMEINKNPEAQYILGSAEPDDIVNKQFTVTGSFETFMDALTYKGYARANTKKALRFEAIGGTTIGSSGTHKPAIRFDLTKVIFETHERSFDNNDIMMQTVSFEGVYDVTAGTILAARLTNAVTGTIYA